MTRVLNTICPLGVTLCSWVTLLTQSLLSSDKFLHRRNFLKNSVTNCHPGLIRHPMRLNKKGSEIMRPVGKTCLYRLAERLGTGREPSDSDQRQLLLPYRASFRGRSLMVEGCSRGLLQAGCRNDSQAMAMSP